MRLALFLIPLSLFGVENIAVVTNASGSSQAPFLVSRGRFFKQGEIAAGNCAAPYRNGTKATLWQFDAKTYWPDGSLMWGKASWYTATTLDNEASETWEFRADAACNSGGSGLTKAAALALDWNAAADYIWNDGTADEFTTTINAKTRMTDLAESSCAIDKWLDGPIVTEFWIKDRCSTLSSSHGAQWSSSGVGCPSTNPCWITAPSDMYKSLNTEFKVAIIPNSNNAVHVEWITENVWTKRKQNQQFALEFRAGDPATVQATKATFSMHYGSRFQYAAWAGSTALTSAYILDQHLPYMVHSRAINPYNMIANTALGTLQSSTGFDGEINWYLDALSSDDPRHCPTTVNKCRQGNACCGTWTKEMNKPGTWGDIAPMPRWYVRWFMGMGEPGISVATKLQYYNGPFMGNAHAATNATYHFRESRTGTPFCSTCPDSTSDEVGRIVSIVANPTNTLQNGITVQFATTVTSCLSGQPCFPDDNGWSVDNENDLSHPYGFAFAVALETGDRYWVEEQMFVGGYSAAQGNPGSTSSTGLAVRLVQYGNINKGTTNGVRRAAMHWRNLAEAHALTPASLPEKGYFSKILLNNLQLRGGEMMMTTADGLHASLYNPSPSCTFSCTPNKAEFTLWQWAYDGVQRTNALSPVDRNCRATQTCANALHLIGGIQGLAEVEYVDNSKAFAGTSSHFDTYGVTALYRVYRLGFPEAEGILRQAVKPFVRLATDPTMNGFLIGSFRWPTTKQLNARQTVTSAVKETSTRYKWTKDGGHGYVAGDTLSMGGSASTTSWKYAKCRNIVPTVVTATEFTLTCTSFGSINDADAFPNDIYVVKSAEGDYFPTWSAWYEAFAPDIRAERTFFPTGGSNDGEYFQVNEASVAIAAEINATADGAQYNGDKAYRWLMSNTVNRINTFPKGSCNITSSQDSLSNCENPTWKFAPWPENDKIRIIRLPTSAVVTFTAVSGHVAKCGVTTAARFDSTLLTDDVEAVMKGLAATCTIPALTPDTDYLLRATSGPLGGTAQHQESFRTRP